MESLLLPVEFIGSILAYVVSAVVLFNVFLRPFLYKMEIQLTRDLFFRLTDQGEFLFSKIIVYSPSNMMITDFNFKLNCHKKGKRNTS